MTKEQAIEAMKTHRVKHPLLSCEWITKCSNNILYFEDGRWMHQEEFNNLYDSSIWDDNWEVLPNAERSVG